MDLLSSPSLVNKLFNRLSGITLGQLLRWLIRIFIVLFVIVFLLFTWFVLWPNSAIPELENVDEYRYLQQGWTQTQREAYYFTPQGTSMPQGSSAGALRYQWFVNLNLPFSNQKISSPQHLRQYRFIVPEVASDLNRDQLPLGFTKHFNPEIGQDVLDISCAACHSGELHVTQNNRTIALRVDGGQAMHAFTDMQRGNFAPVLLASLIYTRTDPWAFDEFAKGVLADNYPQGKDKLKSELTASIKTFLAAEQNFPWKHLYPVKEGFGRTDALGRIGNTVFGDHLSSENYQVGDAPVSYPYLWNIWKFNWVQYNGSVAQPLARNIGEALGVGAQIPLVDDTGNPLPESQRFRSSVRIDDINNIEKLLQKLRPPQWPEELFGVIDQQKAALGEQLFNTYCVECHGPHPATKAQQIASAPLKQSPLDEWLIEVIGSAHIGTDPTAAKGFIERRYNLAATGINQQLIQDSLMPLMVRQLNRNVQFRLSEVINLREKNNLPAGQLPELLGALPDPNESLAVSYPKENYRAIWAELSSFADLRLTLQSLQRPPQIGYQCQLLCQTQRLAWLLKHGYTDINAQAKSFDIRSMSEGVALNLIGILIKQKYYREKGLNYQQQMQIEGFGTIDLPQQIEGYKPRPLAGVWATPPFLHNGSVPSVYQLLLPPSERSKAFYLGDREYDPLHLGYRLKTQDNADAAGFLLDTNIPGNFNQGHGFVADETAWLARHVQPLPDGVIGPLLTDEQRFAIIEFLKIKTDQPECVLLTESGDCQRYIWH